MCTEQICTINKNALDYLYIVINLRNILKCTMNKNSSRTQNTYSNSPIHAHERSLGEVNTIQYSNTNTTLILTCLDHPMVEMSLTLHGVVHFEREM